MSDFDRAAHWQHVYSTKAENAVSWFQKTAFPSLEILKLIGANKRSAIIDIGGGASRLIDDLLALQYENLTVLDLSPAALATARDRIGGKADSIVWIAADITTWATDLQFDVWHERAAFHFLIDPAVQAAYVRCLKKVLRSGGMPSSAPLHPTVQSRAAGCLSCAVLQQACQPSSGLTSNSSINGATRI